MRLSSILTCGRIAFGSLSMALGLMLSVCGAQATDQVLKAPVEDWVEVVQLPAPDPARSADARDGFYNLLWDTQFIKRPGGYTMFDRLAYKIVDRVGLEAGAKIDLVFNPTRHTVSLNFLHIIRDGVLIDRLDGAKFDVFRREQDAERGLFDGRLTAHLDIEDVRVGDIIDYGTTYEITPPLDPGLFFDNFAVESEIPVGLMRRKFIWPEAEPLKIENLRTTMQPRMSSDGQMSIYLWSIENPAPVKIEANRPPGFRSRGIVEVSSTADWNPIAEAAKPYYKVADVFPADFQTKLDGIAAKFTDPADRFIHALRVIQDDIRYVSLSMGEGSHIPRRPETVVASGFGDCKDKALLLVSALRKLGIEAYVALTDIDDGRGLNTGLTTVSAFDHVIVKAKIDGKTYWVDPTYYLQGGNPQTLVAPDYGFALPLTDAPGGALEKIERTPILEPTVDIVERFSFPMKDGDPVILSVETVYRGNDADRLRRQVASNSASKLSNDYLEYYNKQYPGIESAAPLAVADDRDVNVLRTVESYVLPAAALPVNDLIQNFPLKADLGNSNLPTPTAINRVAPVDLGAPVDKRHTILVNNLKAAFAGPENANVENPYVQLRLSSSSTPTTFEVEWRYRTLADQVPAADIASYLAAVGKISQNTYWTYNFGYAEPQAEPMMGFGETVASFALIISALIFIGVGIYETSTRVAVPGQEYVPVPAPKFVLMSLATYGLYGFWWAWRGFWQQKAAHGARIWPFWRALFFPLWMLPAYLDVNSKLAVRRLPLWLGVGAMLVSVILWFGTAAIGMVFEKEPVWWTATDIVLLAVTPLPLVIAIGRLNDAKPEHQGRYSEFTVRDFFAVMLGLLFTGAVLYLEHGMSNVG